MVLSKGSNGISPAKQPSPGERLFQALQEPVAIEEALETVGLMPGGDKSKGYCLEMICADFCHLQWSRSKTPRLKLSHEEYRLLRSRILERDRWHCQE